jgi:hypothetical protein
MSKKAPSRLSGGEAIKKALGEALHQIHESRLSSAPGLSLRFIIDREPGKAKDAPLTDIQRLTGLPD